MEPLEQLKNFSFENATASLWIIRKYVKEKQASYTAKWVKIAGDDQGDANLERQLIATVNGVIEKTKDTLTYDYVCNPDEFCLLTLDAEDTNMPLILEKVSGPGNEHKITNEKELINATGYLIHIQSKDESLYAYKSTSATWKASKIRSIRGAIFSNDCMMGIAQSSIFQIHNDVDFIHYDDTLFVVNKKNFESAMYYKESMVERREDVITDFDESGEFSDTAIIRDFVGSDMRYLRSISSIMDKGFYKRVDFMQRLREKNAEYSWGLQVNENNQIVPTEETMPLLFKLLNDFRLFSELSENFYDVPSTQSIA